LSAAFGGISIGVVVNQDNQNWAERLGRIGADWWATIIAGVIALLAVANVLPKIPW
jgi:uncharacterized RDD family membrane protein YckC